MCRADRLIEFSSFGESTSAQLFIKTGMIDGLRNKLEASMTAAASRVDDEFNLSPTERKLISP